MYWFKRILICMLFHILIASVHERLPVRLDKLWVQMVDWSNSYQNDYIALEHNSYERCYLNSYRLFLGLTARWEGWKCSTYDSDRLFLHDQICILRIFLGFRQLSLCRWVMLNANQWLNPFCGNLTIIILRGIFPFFSWSFQLVFQYSCCPIPWVCESGVAIGEWWAMVGKVCESYNEACEPHQERGKLFRKSQ